MPLKTENPSFAVGKQIAAAFRNEYGKPASPVFEHGQWWIICADGAQYSANDANTKSGFCFEIVTEGDEE